jgi:hypothetical protein
MSEVERWEVWSPPTALAVATKKGNHAMRQHHYLKVLTLSFPLLLLAACGQTTTPSAQATTPPSATPTSTSRPIPPTPTNVPAGWTVYTGVYLSFAYPPGWTLDASDSNPGPNGTPGAINKQYELKPASGYHMLLIEEGDHLDDATIQLNCGGTRRHATIAGLTMLDDSQPSNGRYSYSLYTPQGVSYGLITYLYPNDQASVALVMQIFSTFRPVYTTPVPACK